MNGGTVHVYATGRINGNNRAYEGGGIWNTGTLIIDPGAQITGNTATSYGGGICVYGGAPSVTGVDGTTVFGNFGGGCANYYDANLTPNCQF